MKAKLHWLAERFGGPTALARKLDIAPAYAWQIVNGRRPIQPEHCRVIERATNHEVTRYQLRPDVFGDPADDPVTPDARNGIAV